MLDTDSFELAIEARERLAQLAENLGRYRRDDIKPLAATVAACCEALDALLEADRRESAKPAASNRD